MSRTPTPQQAACMTAVMSGIQMLKIEACAGSGKTSTLAMMAESVVKPSLYLAFNKVTAVEAEQRFPKHVRAQTTHSRAYAAFGVKLQHKLSRPKGAYVNVAGTGAEIQRYFNIESFESSDGVTVTGPFIGLLARDTVARFEQSDMEKLDKCHAPTYELRRKLNDNHQAVAFVVGAVLKIAKKLWEERINPASVVLATHDTYLKLFQLSKPVFHGIQVLYVDEYQDTTPCVMDIVMNQAKHMQIVMVGDARQAIYGWRGAVNAMELTNCHAQALTKSFRYGTAVAAVATSVLQGAMQIEGNEAITSKVGLFGVVDRTKHYTRLFRTNSALLYAAVEEISKGTKVNIEIDVRDFVKVLQSAVALYQGDKKNVKHEKLLPYTTWDEMVEESKGDAELGRLCKIIKEGLADRWCSILETHRNSDNPAVTFTTAHKAKGREWLQVVIESDFKSNYEEEEWIGLPVEEQNLLYVAVTRAIECLEYNYTTQEYLNEDEAYTVSDAKQPLQEAPQEETPPWA